ncbi:rRNA maturation RNase YbeY [Lacticigenium naphthae]|uniref:rRNA maturation RNase YbeY n=1 Tax=Lacticigenium naphthae TaxID=515351 RepID=UPI0004142CF6|nr:rRNA maturation RNase YbeY [Lacticigenium naphthae]
MDIQILDETKELEQQHLDLIHSIIEFSAKKLAIEEDAEISVTIVSSQRIKEINREYRGKDSITDVISFAMEDEADDEFDFNWNTLDEELPRALGDIFICLERTKEQAVDYGHSFERELGFLTVHGFLHLNGYDHLTEVEEKEMFSLQNELLEEYGLERK